MKARRMFFRMQTLRCGWFLVACLLAPQVFADAIDDFVSTEMQRQGVPGVAVGIFRQGDALRLQGYGLANIEHQVPVRADTVFQSGSLGKMFTAAAVAALVEDGLLAWDAPVRRYLPEAPSAWQAIHLRHLLNHTSGLGEPPLELQREYRDDELLALISQVPARFGPGQRWEYSNAGYALLGIVVGKVAGRPYGEVLKDRVFRPAGMPSARVISEADIVMHRASGYELQQGVLKNQHWNSAALNATADGSLYLSLRDLAQWDAVVARRGIFKTTSWQEILRPALLNDGTRYPYGFGWRLSPVDAPHGSMGHGGTWQGFKTEMRRYDKDGVTFVVLANASHADVEHLLQGVAERYDARYRVQGPQPR